MGPSGSSPSACLTYVVVHIIPMLHCAARALYTQQEKGCKVCGMLMSWLSTVFASYLGKRMLRNVL
eukprot:1138547-Pelagomonas_calceolata.AAC.1